MLKQRVIYVLFIVLLNVMSSSVSASCKTIDDLRPNADGTVTDRRKGTIWKMCPEGMAWNGRACVGTEIRLNWYDSIKHASNARDIGKSDWRLPTTLDVQDLVVNKKKCLDQHPDADKFATPPFLAHIPVVAPAFDMDMWLSNTEPTSQTAAMTFNIYVGLIGTNGKSNAKRAIRLVRSGSDLAASLAKSEFVRMNEDQQANETCLLYTSPSPRDRTRSRMPSSA